MAVSVRVSGWGPCGVQVKFSDRPPDEVLQALKANRFRWSPRETAWIRESRGPYADLVDWIRRKLEPNRPDGTCWDCQRAPGRFRNRGARAPVLCDACAAKDGNR